MQFESFGLQILGRLQVVLEPDSGQRPNCQQLVGKPCLLEDIRMLDKGSQDYSFEGDVKKCSKENDSYLHSYCLRTLFAVRLLLPKVSLSIYICYIYIHSLPI